MDNIMAKKATSRKATAKNKQAFTYNAPSATSVMLVGDFTHWQKSPISMQKRADGFWHAEVELAPGTYHYKFIVDGEWRDDPECTLRIPNPFGTFNAVREVK